MTPRLPDPALPRPAAWRGGPGPQHTVPPPPAPAGSLRYARFLPATDAEGPGTRAALWLQGCGIRCPGCFNPHLWTTRGGIDADTEALASDLVEQARRADAEGLTLLGGEPFEQAAAAAVVAKAFQSAGLGVMTFTGYTHRDLTGWALDRPDIAALLSATDLLADGPYLADRPERHRPWIGSTNQGLRALTPRYRQQVSALSPRTGQESGDPAAQPPLPRGDAAVGNAAVDRLELRIGPDGTVEVNGWAETEQLEYLLEGLRRPAPPRPGRSAGFAPATAPVHPKEAS